MTLESVPFGTDSMTASSGSGRYSGLATSKRVGIADVAARAGVGVGTVSRVLNGSPHVRERTRQRVLDAISQTSYQPSRLAAALSRGTPGSVAIIVPFLTRPSVVARLAGVIEVLDAEGYDTIVCNVESEAQRDRQVRLFSDGHRAAGAVVVSLRLSDAQLAGLAVARMPVVAVDVAMPGVPGIIVDDVRGGMLATDHLLELGHRRIGFIGDTGLAGGLTFSSTPSRLRGYRQALSRAGIAPARGLIRRGQHGSTAAEQMTLSLLSKPDPPTAIFAASDTQAAGVLSAAESARIPVPERLSVIGFDDVEIAAPLGLSTVRQPLRESGVRGATRLCALLKGDRAVPMREELPLEVVPRRSTASPAAAASPVRTAKPAPAASPVPTAKPVPPARPAPAADPSPDVRLPHNPRRPGPSPGVRSRNAENER